MTMTMDLANEENTLPAAQPLTNQELINYHIKQISGHADLTAKLNLFYDLTKTYCTASMLSRLIYWSDRATRADGFVYKSAADWKAETRASRHQVRLFKDLPFIITKVQKANKHPTTHYKIDFAKLIQALYDLQSQAKPGANEESQSMPADQRPSDQNGTNHPHAPNDPLPTQESPTPRAKSKYRYPKLRNRGKNTPITEPSLAGNGAKMPPIETSSPPDGGKITPSEDLQPPDMGAKLPLSEPSQTPDGGKNALSMGQNQPGIGAKLPQHGGEIDKSLTINTTINTSNNTNNNLKDLKDLKDFSAVADFSSNSQAEDNDIDSSTEPKTEFLENNPDCQEPTSDPFDPPSDPVDKPTENNPSKSNNKFPNYQEFLKELAEITQFDLGIKSNAGRLGRAASQLLDAGYTVDDLKNFFNHWIENDWRWKNNDQFPKPETVLSDIAQVKAVQDKAYYERQKYKKWLR